MTNQIAIVYDSISILLNGMRSGVPVYGKHTMSRKSVPSLVFPEVEKNSVAQVTFRNVSATHTILARFIKKTDAPLPDTGGTVTFVSVKGVHTIQVTFRRNIPVPNAVGNRTKLLLNYDIPMTLCDSHYELKFNSPLLLADPASIGYISSVVGYLKDDSVYDHIVAQSNVEVVTNNEVIGLLSTDVYACGSSSYDSLNHVHSGTAKNNVVQIKKPDCKIGVNDFTIDFWWRPEPDIRCGLFNALHNMESVYKQQGFFEILESNPIKKDGTYNYLPNFDLSDFYGVRTPVSLEQNRSAQIRNYMRGFFSYDEDDPDITELDSGTASDSVLNGEHVLVDSSKSWEPDAFVGKFVWITSGTGSTPVLSGSRDVNGELIWITAEPKLIIGNTPTELHTAVCEMPRYLYPHLTIDNPEYGFPEFPDDTSGYVIQYRVPKCRLKVEFSSDLYEESFYILGQTTDPERPSRVNPAMWVGYNERLGQYDLAYVYSGIVSYETLIDGEFHHIAFVKFNGDLVCYFDGNPLVEELNVPFQFKETAIDPNCDNWMLETQLDPVNGWVDAFRIDDVALWEQSFDPLNQGILQAIDWDSPLTLLSTLSATPVIVPYETESVFESSLWLEVSLKNPGEQEALLGLSVSFEVVVRFSVSSVQFESSANVHLFKNIVELQRDFVFSNRWLKELMGVYSHVPGVEGDYRAALMNISFTFNPDVHEYFVDQVGDFEITSVHGYISGKSLRFKNFSIDGILSFEDFEFPIATGGTYGPANSLIIYDYASDVRGLIVGCLTFPTVLVFSESTMKLSDLSFQIVQG